MRILIVLFLSIVGGCSLLDTRSFFEEMNEETDGLFVPGEHFSVAIGDKERPYRNAADIRKRTPLFKRERKKIVWQRSLENELHNKEKALNEREYERYMDSIPYLGHVSEKIYYLNLSSRERRKYIKNKRFREQEYKKRKSGISLLTMREFGRSDIRPGMDKRAVLERWGRPVRVDIAGDPARQNERWSFYHSGRWRQIYFEGGLVRGWRMNDE